MPPVNEIPTRDTSVVSNRAPAGRPTRNPRGILRVHSVSSAGAVLVTALVATGAGAAHGQELSYADGASDVHLIQADDSTTLHGDMVNTDVTTVLVDHRNRRLKARFGFTDLARTGQGFVTLLQVRTSEGRRFNVVVVATPGGWRGQPVLQTLNGKELECASLRRAIDYDANTVKVSMGTDCLDRPRWVQVGLLALSSPTADTFYIDDAQHPDVPVRSTLSRKIRRG